jgi:acetylornithine aminotransferase
MGSLSVTASEKYRRPYEPLIPGVTHLPFNNISALDSINESTCAVIIEPIQGEGGVYPASSEFLLALRKRCDEVNALLIYDEIQVGLLSLSISFSPSHSELIGDVSQCGLGRTGHLFAHHAYGPKAIPDIMTLAKPLANGVPIGAILISEKVATCMGVGDHGTTFGGSPLATRVALEVFGRISRPEFLESVRVQGKALKERLQEVADAEGSSLIQEVRGDGLLLGLEMKGDSVNAMVEAARERGLLLVAAGRNTIRVIPPLIIGGGEIEEGIRILKETCVDLSS